MASGQMGPTRSGRLYIVGTPIGNLGDLTPRAASAFESADAVCCEDTRVTSKLMAHLGISKPLIRCDENVIADRAPQIVDRLLAGETIAFAADAGMPSVSDPGQALVDAARDAGVDVEVIPGPSACVTALVSSGISCDNFFFGGFLPRKHGERVRRLRQLAFVPGALVFYESPHRAEASLAALAEVFPARVVALCRELTKLHEEVLRAPAPDLHRMVLERGDMRGEMVIVVAPPDEGESTLPMALEVDVQGDREAALRRDIEEALAQGEAVSAMAKRLAQRHSLKKREVYERILEVQGGC
ncbi:MAG: 16S rRNA (cytidine(1402)-2'-O)-methyltransferase [Collinsella sp.]|nr:16S rRNA (cytidine(1402)-2'-O)-methyltransferase [Collinsella sp.]